MEKGQWVFFQNCHLAPSWMPALERLVEQVDPDHVRTKIFLIFNRGISLSFFLSMPIFSIINHLIFQPNDNQKKI